MVVQDTIKFSISAEKVVVNHTVKIVANVVAMVTQDMTETKLKDSIREVMQRFIKADWQFSNMNRTSHAARMEQVNLTATARVPEAENYALDRRREEASRDGLNIAAATVDTSPTPEQIETAQRELRLALLAKVQDEIDQINGAADANYRMGRVVFAAPENTGSANRMIMASAAATKMAYGSGFGPDDDSIGNAVKLTMVAKVTLKAWVDREDVI